MSADDLFRDAPPSRKPGRPPVGKRSMTPLERQRRHRKQLAAEKAKAMHAPKRLRREARERELADKTITAGRALGTKFYGVLYGDPPWRWEPRSRETGLSRSAENHYPTMILDEIKALQIPGAPDCVLFLWATVPMKPQALEVIEAWGFTYKSTRYWVKPQIGTGFWFRNQVEELLVATRGNVPAPALGDQPNQVVVADRGAHSVKPDIFADDIARLYPNVPKLELFARSPRAGWDVWGNEADSPRDSALDDGGAP